MKRGLIASALSLGVLAFFIWLSFSWLQNFCLNNNHQGTNETETSHEREGKSYGQKPPIVGLLKSSIRQTNSQRIDGYTQRDKDKWKYEFFCEVKGTGFALGWATILLVIATCWLAFIGIRQELHLRDTAEKQLRAYISHEGFSLNIEAPNNIIQRIVFTPKIKNTGTTPARSCEIWSDLALIGKQDPLPAILKESRHYEGSSSTLSASQTAFGRALGVPWGDIQEILDGKSRLFFWTLTEYNDIFDKPRHRQTFCEVEMSTTIDRQIVPDKFQDPFRYRFVGKQNTES